MQRLHGFRPFLHGQAVDVDGGAHLIAFQHFEDAPDTSITAVVSVRKRDQVDLLALGLLEVTAVRKRLERYSERGADFFSLRPFNFWTFAEGHFKVLYCAAGARDAGSPYLPLKGGGRFAKQIGLGSRG